MLGRKKMYKRGMADALHANESFAKKQQAAIDFMRREVQEGSQKLEDALNRAIRHLDGCIAGFSKYLNATEKAALYKLSSSMDIREFDDSERHLLVAVLYQLASDEGALLTNDQRKFVRSVQKYVGVSNPQIHADLSVVGEIDSLEVQKAFLRVVLEFLYLQDGEELSDSQDEFLSCFSVNKRHAELIEEQVGHLYEIVGPEGIAEKYGFDPCGTERSETKASRSNKPFEEEWRKVERVMDEVVEIFKTKSSNWLIVKPYDFPEYNICGDDYSLKSEAQNCAEQELHKIYDTAASALNPYSDSSLAMRAVDDISGVLDARFELIKEQIRQFAKVTGCHIEAQQMEDSLNTVSFLNSVREYLADELRSKQYKYSLESFAYYAKKIEYISDDLEIETGFLRRFLEKMAAQWTYYLTDASMELDSDFESRQTAYASAAAEIIVRELLTSVFSKIRAVYVKLFS